MNKSIVLGITGGIAAYKACELIRLITRSGATVRPILTQNGAKFITKLSVQTLSGNRAYSDTFEQGDAWEIGHISLAQSADAIVVAPATANVLAKVCAGVCDDLLTTTICAADCPVIFAPAMNTKMWLNPIVQRNVRTLTELGYLFVPPGYGELACKDVGEGKMAEPAQILEHIRSTLCDKPLAGKRLLISAGPTCEALDPVRHLTNRSSGKMGFALARVAWRMGAQVELISGPVCLDDPVGVNTVRVASAAQMLEQLEQRFSESDILIMSAAVADVRPTQVADTKLPKSELPQAIPLEATPDIVSLLAARRRAGQLIVGFAAETDAMSQKARDKLQRKGLDMIVANDVSRSDIGFDSENNEVTIYIRDGEELHVELSDKERVARAVLSKAAELLGD
ncbi:MAG: bifunctional phosphopantothenoylcysteine decarboxylase/phosphopantothenate--cysteine ligase CoaBC [Candidatus Alcyoniella australis]|nr:bifunctional phosphopantothenoylcysteine decarboxylase/phosphopantothenate--cysteine ligase CoaBC [Candidatus Alcyoniella australis]